MRVYEIRETRGIESITPGDRPVPQLADRQVLVRIKAVSLNYSDLSVTRGAYSRNTPLPFVLGSDGVGNVADIGSAVTRVGRDERVALTFMPKWIQGPITEAMTRAARGRTIDGTLAEFVAVDENAVVKVPEYLSDEEAATLPTAGLTAWNALVSHGKLQPGEWVLTLGTGGVSLFATQFAQQIGARVIGSSGSVEKLERLRQMGLREVINYRATPDWAKRVREVTNGGVDLIAEVGGAATLEQSLRAVRVGGRISLIGGLGGAGAINPMPIVMKSITVQGIYVGSREMFESMNEFLSMHRLRPVIDRTFDFDNAREAFEYLESWRHFGKVCVRVG